MFRLMLTLFAFLWSAVLDGDGSGSGSGSGEGGGQGGGQSGGSGDSFTLSEAELTQRTEKAASDKVSELAGILGVDLSNPSDVKAMIEAGRKAQQTSGGSDSNSRNSGEGEADGLDALLDTLDKINGRLDGIEGKETDRERAAAERTRDEKLTAALKEANVRDDRLDAARTLAIANGATLNDKGELQGSREAIEATKTALPEAFRGDGDNGQSADAGGRERTDRKPKNLSEALTAHYSK